MSDDNDNIEEEEQQQQEQDDEEHDDDDEQQQDDEEKIELFEDAGDAPGIQVWRLKKMTPILVDEGEHGRFYQSDCYIVLKTFESNLESERLIKMHLWMGVEANNKKRSICAYMADELSNALHEKSLKASRFQEEQGEEQEQFLEYFKTKLFFLRGELTNETLKTYKPVPAQVRLIKIESESNTSQLLASKKRAKHFEIKEQATKYAEIAVYNDFGHDDDDNVKHTSSSNNQNNDEDDYDKPLVLSFENEEEEEKPLVLSSLDDNENAITTTDDVAATTTDTAPSTTTATTEPSTQEEKGKQVRNKHVAFVAKRIAMFPKPSFAQVVSEKDALILEGETNIFVWLGKSCPQQKSIKAMDVASMIFAHERKGRNCTAPQVVQQGAEPVEFWSIFEKYKGVLFDAFPKGSTGDAIDSAILYQVNVDGEKKVDLSKIQQRPLLKSMLQSNLCYMLQTGAEVYAWIGKSSSELIQKYARALAQKLANENKLLVFELNDGYESVLFQDRFLGFYMQETPATFEQRRLGQSNINKFKISNQIVTDYEDERDIKKRYRERHPYYDLNDDGLGGLSVYKILNSTDYDEIPDNEIGHFYLGDCYLILYEFNRAEVEFSEEDEGDWKKAAAEKKKKKEAAAAKKKQEEEEEYEPASDEEGANEDDEEAAKRKLFEQWFPEQKEIVIPTPTPSDDENEDDEDEDALNKNPNSMMQIITKQDVKKKRIAYLDRRILYAWEGSESKEKLFCRMIKKNFDNLANDPLNPARIIDLEFGKEDEHFMLIFKYQMIIHRGRSADANKHNTMRLYRIYVKSEINARAIEVDKRKYSLNSNDVFVLSGKNSAWIWIGRFANEMKRRLAIKFASILCKGKDVESVREGAEPFDFWEDLDPIYADVDQYVTNYVPYENSVVYESYVTSEHKYKRFESGTIAKNFNLTDLHTCHNLLLFQFDNVIFVWYPHANLHQLEKDLALKALDSLKATYQDKVQKQVNYDVYFVVRGEEPPVFQHAFMEWRKTAMPFVDTFQIKREETLQKHAKKLRQILPLLRDVRKLCPQFLCDDEAVNMENLLFVVELGQKMRTYGDFIDQLSKTDNFPLDDMMEIDDFAGIVAKHLLSVFNVQFSE